VNRALGFELQIDRHRGAQDIEHRTMGVDHLFRLGEIGQGCGALQMHRAAHVVEAGAHALFYSEEAAEVERAFTETLSSGMPSAVA
jgi:hypothetical protein